MSSPRPAQEPLINGNIDAWSIHNGPARDKRRSRPASSAQPHERFSFPSDFVSLRIKTTQFYLPSFILSMHSERFKKLLASRSPGTAVEQIALQDIDPIGFERLLSILIPIVPGQLELTSVKEWTSVLNVAHTLEFRTIESLALAQIEPLASAVDKIVLGQEYDLPQWTTAGCLDLCQREDPISRDEGRRLGVDIVTDISIIRHNVHRDGVHAQRVDEDRVRTFVSSLPPTLQDSMVAGLLDGPLVGVVNPESSQPGGSGEGLKHGGGREATSENISVPTATQEVDLTTQPPAVKTQESAAEAEKVPPMTISAAPVNVAAVAPPLPSNTWGFGLRPPQQATDCGSGSRDVFSNVPSTGADSLPTEPNEQTRIARVLELRKRSRELDFRVLELYKQMEMAKTRPFMVRGSSVTHKEREIAEASEKKLKIEVEIREAFDGFDPLDDPPERVELAKCGVGPGAVVAVENALERHLYPGIESQELQIILAAAKMGQKQKVKVLELLERYGLEYQAIPFPGRIITVVIPPA